MQGRVKKAHVPFTCGTESSITLEQLQTAYSMLYGMVSRDDIAKCAVHGPRPIHCRVVNRILGNTIIPQTTHCDDCIRLYGMRLVQSVLGVGNESPFYWAMQCMGCDRVICESHWHGCNESLLCRQCCLGLIRNTGITPAIQPLLLPEWRHVIAALRNVYIYHRVKKTRWGQLDRDIWKRIAIFVITTPKDLPKKSLLYNRRDYFK